MSELFLPRHKGNQQPETTFQDLAPTWGAAMNVAQVPNGQQLLTAGMIHRRFTMAYHLTVGSYVHEDCNFMYSNLLSSQLVLW